VIGAIIGDVVGSVYEFNNHRSKQFFDRASVQLSWGNLPSDRAGFLTVHDQETDLILINSKATCNLGGFAFE